MPQFRLARAVVAACATATFAIPSSALAAQGEVGCADVDVLVTRGSAEPSGSSLALDGSGGVNGPSGVWTYIRKEMQTPTDGSTPIGQIVRTDIDYPADLPYPSSIQGSVGDSAVFKRSVRLGTFRVITYLNSEHARCPNKRFVLLGYSQGAIVIKNALTQNPNLRLWIDSVAIPELNPNVVGKVAAIGTFADVGFNQLSGWATHADTTVGTEAPAYLHHTKDDLNRGQNDGTSSRVSQVQNPRDPAALSAFTGKIRDYCLQNDFICQGSGGLNEHLYYMDPLQPAPRKNLAIFAIQQLRNKVDKQYSATCTVESSTNGAGAGTSFPATLRFEATINDRVAPGGTASMTGIASTLSFPSASAAKLRTALGGATQVTRSIIAKWLVGTPSSGSASTRLFAAFNDSTLPISGSAAFSVAIPGAGGGTPKTLSWTAPSSGRLDFAAEQSYRALFYSSGGSATLDCQMPSTATHTLPFGRIIVS